MPGGPPSTNSSMLAQGKSAGLITRRSLDRNQDMLSTFFFFFSPLSLRRASISLSFLDYRFAQEVRSMLPASLTR
ncbi:hypothetical protein BJX65DRAFT_279723 [Aspergillus insuetus]